MDDTDRAMQIKAVRAVADAEYYGLPTDHTEYQAGAVAMNLLRGQRRYFVDADSLECVDGLGWDDTAGLIAVEGLDKDGAVVTHNAFVPFTFDRGTLSDENHFPTYYSGSREVSEEEYFPDRDDWSYDKEGKPVYAPPFPDTDTALER